MDAARGPDSSGRRRNGGGGGRSAVPPIIESPAWIDRASPHPSPLGQAPRVRVALAIGDVPMLSFGFRAAIDAEPDMVVVAEIVEPADLVERLRELAVEVAIVAAGPVSGLARGAIAAFPRLWATVASRRFQARLPLRGQRRLSTGFPCIRSLAR